MAGFKQEWDRWLPVLSSKQAASIYFGGGTPALLGAELIGEIIERARKGLSFAVPSPEITLEANPENVTRPLMQSYAAVGINRVSIGIQTLDDSLLGTLGRTHSAKRALEAVEETSNAGISNITVDLMYDLPGQNLQAWENTLRQVVKLPITHLSLYNLTIEPHTAFFKRKKDIEKQMPDGDMSLQMYEMAVDILEAHGLLQYEISAFAREGFQSRHNYGYWTARPFIGFGPSAFSYWEGKRFRNVANLSKYCKHLDSGESPLDFEERLQPIEARRELLAIQLRLLEGVDIEKFERLHGEIDKVTHEMLIHLISQGFIEKTGSRINLTRRGILFYDTVATEIV